MHAPRVAVATSGGRDSSALLHCTLRQAREVGVQVWALHVHHGLMADADAWARQVRGQASRWGAEFASTQLSESPAAGDSIEAWAREQRYAALAQMAHHLGITLVLLAHHRQDQAETWLLQALRGAGVAGLSAMPRSAEQQGITWARPWLDLPRASVEAYVRRHRLAHAQDSSNSDSRFARSRLRQRVWPTLLRAFPDAELALNHAAQQAQEAAALAAEVAAADLDLCSDGGNLLIKPWLLLSPARRSNALRAWLRAALGASAPRSLVQRLLNELPGVDQGRWPAPDATLALHRGRLCMVPPQQADPPGETQELTLDLSNPGRVDLAPWGGHWCIERCRSGGVATDQLRQVRAHGRRGGERFRVAPTAAARSLKKQFQAGGVPAWARGGPLLFSVDGRLIYVPGLGVDAAFHAAPGVDQRSLRWQPD
jgi:tRNA(Ile)-lysidine synthase